MCRLRNIHVAMRDYQGSVTTGETDGRTERQTDAGQSDPYVPLCFAGDTKTVSISESELKITCKKLYDLLWPQYHLSIPF